MQPSHKGLKKKENLVYRLLFIGRNAKVGTLGLGRVETFTQKSGQLATLFDAPDTGYQFYQCIRPTVLHSNRPIWEAISFISLPGLLHNTMDKNMLPDLLVFEVLLFHK